MLTQKLLGLLESYLYAVDKRYCFYRGERIKGADRNTFKVVDTALAFHIAMDRFHYYKGNEITTKEQLKKDGLNIK
jgi:hypothetical protein